MQPHGNLWVFVNLEYLFKYALICLLVCSKHIEYSFICEGAGDGSLKAKLDFFSPFRQRRDSEKRDMFSMEKTIKLNKTQKNLSNSFNYKSYTSSSYKKKHRFCCILLRLCGCLRLRVNRKEKCSQRWKEWSRSRERKARKVVRFRIHACLSALFLALCDWLYIYFSLEKDICWTSSKILSIFQQINQKLSRKNRKKTEKAKKNSPKTK